MRPENKYAKIAVPVLLGLIIILALGLRGNEFLNKIHDFYLAGDARNYHIMSHQIVDNHVYGYALGRKSVTPNAYITPGYPLFLASVYAIFHDIYLQITVVKLLQVIIGGLVTPLFAFLFVRRLFKRNDAALLTALFIAVYPTYILSAAYLLTEVLSLAAMVIYFYLVTAALQDKKPLVNLLAGVSFASAVLVRPSLFPLFIVPFIFAWLTAYKKNRKLLLKLFAYNLLGLTVIMLPWWIRNFTVLHRFILLATGSEDPLLAGTYPYMQGLFKDYLSEKVRVSEAAYARKRIIEGFTQQPLLYMKWYTIGKLDLIFSKPWLLEPGPYGTIFQTAYYKFMDYFHAMLLVLGTTGMIINSALKKTNLFIGLYALCITGLLLVFIPVDRYAYPVMFFLMLSSAVFICTAADLLIKRPNKGGF